MGKYYAAQSGINPFDFETMYKQAAELTAAHHEKEKQLSELESSAGLVQANLLPGIDDDAIDAIKEYKAGIAQVANDLNTKGLGQSTSSNAYKLASMFANVITPINTLATTRKSTAAKINEIKTNNPFAVVLTDPSKMHLGKFKNGIPEIEQIDGTKYKDTITKLIQHRFTSEKDLKYHLTPSQSAYYDLWKKSNNVSEEDVNEFLSNKEGSNSNARIRACIDLANSLFQVDRVTDENDILKLQDLAYAGVYESTTPWEGELKLNKNGMSASSSSPTIKLPNPTIPTPYHKKNVGNQGSGSNTGVAAANKAHEQFQALVQYYTEHADKKGQCAVHVGDVLNEKYGRFGDGAWFGSTLTKSVAKVYHPKKAGNRMSLSNYRLDALFKKDKDNHIVLTDAGKTWLNIIYNQTTTEEVPVTSGVKKEHASKLIDYNGKLLNSKGNLQSNQDIAKAFPDDDNSFGACVIGKGNSFMDTYGIEMKSNTTGSSIRLSLSDLNNITPDSILKNALYNANQFFSEFPPGYSTDIDAKRAELLEEILQLVQNDLQNSGF